MTLAFNPLIQNQANINRSTAESWNSFAPHRRRVTRLIVDQCLRQGSNSRVAILGAGNCNDLDLKLLVASCATVDLFDLDTSALTRGIRSQSMESSRRLFRYGNVDFTGILPQLATLPQNTDRQTELEKLVHLASRIPLIGNAAGYDVVASTCVLTQLILSVALALGEAEPLLPLLVFAMRKAHFGLLGKMVAPSGTILFVSDLVSSDTCRELLVCSDDDLQPLMESVIRDRNFFTGLNPYTILRMLSQTAHDPCLHAPWLWRLSSQRAALAYALTFRHK